MKKLKVGGIEISMIKMAATPLLEVKLGLGHAFPSSPTALLQEATMAKKKAEHKTMSKLVNSSILNVLADHQLTTQVSFSHGNPLLHVNAYELGERKFTLKLGLRSVPEGFGWFIFKGHSFIPNILLSSVSPGVVKLFNHLNEHGVAELGKEPGKKTAPSIKEEKPTGDMSLREHESENIDEVIKCVMDKVRLNDQPIDKKLTMKQKLIKTIPWLNKHPELIWLKDLSSLDVARTSVDLVKLDNGYVLLLMQIGDYGTAEVFHAPLSTSYVPYAAGPGKHFLINIDGDYFESETFIDQASGFNALQCLSRLARASYESTDGYEVTWAYQ